MRFGQKRGGVKKSGRRGSTLIALVIVALSAAAFAGFFRGFVSGVHRTRAETLFREGYFGLAEHHLKKAADYRPGDDRIQKELGNVQLKLAGLSARPGERVFRLKAADDYFRQAADLNPNDAETVYRLARTTALLDQQQAHLPEAEQGKPDICLHYFREAVQLRPNGIMFHYAMARRLYALGRQADLPAVVRKLTRIYPPVYSHLRREPFWTPAVRAAGLEGLQDAVAQKTRPRDAHMAISALLAEEKKWPGAIAHCRAALEIRTFQNTSGDNLRLGTLFMKNDQIEQARACFFTALKTSRHPEKDLERLFHIHKKQDCMDALFLFYENARRLFSVSSALDVLVARVHVELKQPDAARRLLEAVNLRKPRADAYYWLSRVAEDEKDWDRQEIAVQKATVLDPENSRYHLCFSRVLKRLQKFERAEKAAGRAIKYAGKPSPWLFNHRAWVRWSRKDYLGAARDWQRAIRLMPDRAGFYANVAESYLRMGERELTLEYYEKAMVLDPGNARYQKKHLELINRDSVRTLQGA